MARIQEISTSELRLLRNLILDKYSSRNHVSIGGKLNAYLPNYDQLVEDMEDVVPGYPGSISRGRLRKLFYYTDPGKVEKDQLEQNRFGLDFLDACYSYVSDNTLDRRKYLQAHMDRPPLFRLKRVLMIGTPIALLFATWLYTCVVTDKVSPTSVPFEENFDSALPEDLEANGWFVLDPLPEFLEKQTSDGHFTMYTLPGGYYTKPSEAPIAHNTLVRRIPPRANRIIARFDRFEPYMKWQGVALILFDESLNKHNIVTATYTYGGDPEGAIYGIYQCCLNGAPYGPWHGLYADSLGFDGPIVLGLSFGDNTYKLLSQARNDWDPYTVLAEIETDFAPAYVGIHATQGLTDPDGNPIGADTLAVQLDYVRME